MANSPHPSLRLVTPAPGGVKGRIDQGEDWGNIRGNIVAVGSGVIATIYQGLQGFGTTIIERLSGGQDVYYGLESGGGTPYVTPGERVQQGEAVAPGLGTGGIEVGFWNPATGASEGAPGYREGSQTAAGQAFASAITGGITSSGAANAGQQSSLAGLWIEAGGSPALANIEAAIAMAESAGKVDAQHQNADGTTDNGLWQINSSHTQFDQQRLREDPLYNAQAAVAIEKQQGLSAWTTYTSGAYKQFLNQPDMVQGYGGTRPGPAGSSGSGGGGSAASGTVPQLLDNYVLLRDMPRTAPPGTKNPFSWWIASFTGDWNKVGSSNP